jgi:hypothetical protein
VGSASFVRENQCTLLPGWFSIVSTVIENPCNLQVDQQRTACVSVCCTTSCKGSLDQPLGQVGFDRLGQSKPGFFRLALPGPTEH